MALVFALTPFGSSLRAQPTAVAAPQSDSAVAAAHGLVAGARIRYATDAYGVMFRTARLVRVAPDSLVVDRSRSVQLARLTRLELSRGRRAVGTRLARGTLIGVTFGAILGVAQEENPDRFIGGETRVGTAAFGAVLGGAIGAVVGLVMPSERWVNIPLPLRRSVPTTPSAPRPAPAA